MGLAQLAIILFDIYILCVASRHHGGKMSMRVNFWVILAYVVLGLAVLAFGGFFNGAFNFKV